MTTSRRGMNPQDARLLIEEELLLDSEPERNLATFVTTWMGPNVRQLIAENLHRNFIDHAEYPQTAEIEQRCIRMMASLFNAPGETTGARSPGLVRGDHARRAGDEVEVARAPARRRRRGPRSRT